ncbi:hypothetical protein V2G26_014452 [Clonostachys chloroleuca]
MSELLQLLQHLSMEFSSLRQRLQAGCLPRWYLGRPGSSKPTDRGGLGLPKVEPHRSLRSCASKGLLRQKLGAIKIQSIAENVTYLSNPSADIHPCLTYSLKTNRGWLDPVC